MENWKFALKSIMAHKMRSLLTMLGIIIGVAAVCHYCRHGNRGGQKHRKVSSW